MSNEQRTLERIAQAARLREGPAGVAALLRQLYRQSPLATAKLARRLGWPVPVTAAVRRELEGAGLLARTPRGSELSAQGHDLARALGLHGREDPLCPRCGGRRILVDPDRWQGLLHKLRQVHQDNPTVDTTLDQAHGTPETALRRALAMYHEGALEGQALLILGDDDLVSVAVGLLSRELAGGRLLRRLTVLDVDRRFLEHIEAAGRELDLAIETIAHDLRQPLPEELRGQFHTAETDPPYTLPGLRLFLGRALEGLRPEGGRDLFVSYAPRDPAGQRDLLAACTDLGLAPFSVTPDFNRYAGAATLAGSGQFLHLRTTTATPSPAAGAYGGPLYTMDLQPGRRAYRCQGCETVWQVGPGGDFPTIEALKVQGCPRCGGHTFRPGRRNADS
ncbi:MAG: bis-aminopropyl spermidine synthase family protein [Chloroflexia bacterium]|nr:bis-aminopropyl spermidine synthase family protein [Chloroflexia bacterium]